MTDQVGPRDVTPHVPGGDQAATGLAIGAGAMEQLGGKDPLRDNPLRTIDIADELVERVDPLLESPLDPLPLGNAWKVRFDRESCGAPLCDLIGRSR